MQQWLFLSKAAVCDDISAFPVPSFSDQCCRFHHEFSSYSTIKVIHLMDPSNPMAIFTTDEVQLLNSMESSGWFPSTHGIKIFTDETQN
ncbi:hypothetical protein [Sphingobacterium athyrii]|uniref:Uncharacterized protein n=1 Tax=Sphingobacterium athyrii TaxID=2152717 RepID=A0A363NK36_9SPHI|nr:hypothetical protein [Sphingobacterium athyrii]PUV21135.1 hypothetical protein DCO56_28285 [Sphingobacterium athyrii]